MSIRAMASVVGVGMLLAAAPASAPAAPRDGDFSRAALTRTLRTGLHKANIPGVVVGVWRGDELLYRRGVGVRSTATRRRLTSDVRTRIGSVTKSFVATAVLQLVDQGKVGLDDPIDRYVPGVPNGSTITIRQLAAMRSGLWSYTNDIIPKVLARDPSRQWAPDELLALSFAHAPIFAPGTEFDYSNTNTVLLGRVVEIVSGQPLSEYLKQHVIDPAGLRNTLFPRAAEFPSPHSQGYTNWTATGFSQPPDGRILNATNWNPSWGWAAGAMISSLDDLHVWARGHSGGKLLSPAIQQQREQFMTAPGEGGATYGLGMMNYGGWIGHDGNLPGYITFPFYLPAEDTTLVVMFNSNANPLGCIAMLRQITKVITPEHLWPIPPAE